MDDPSDLSQNPPGAPGRDSSRLCFHCTLLIIFLGALFRIAQWLANISFWQDEAYVVLNLRSKTAGQLLGALRTRVAGMDVPPQTAPPLYLLSLKALTQALGQSEWVWRLPAVAMGVIALPLMALVAWHWLSPWAATIATAWLALSEKLIDHTVMVKQYSGDVAACLLLLALATETIGADRAMLRTPARRLCMMALASAILVWWSEPVVFVYAGVSVAWWLGHRRCPRASICFVACSAVAASSFLVLYFVSLRHQKDPELFAFWADSLLPHGKPWRWPLWMIWQLYTLLDYPFAKLGVCFAVLCIVALRYAGTRLKLATLGLPILLTLLAAIARQYPFGGSRVCLFLMPPLLLLAGRGLMTLTEFAPRIAQRRWIVVIAAGPMIVSGLIQGAYHLRVPRCVSDLRPAVEYVQQRYHDGESIIVAGQNTWPVFFVYWPSPPTNPILLPDERAAQVRAAQVQAAQVRGRFWCVCEYAPGEYARKRAPVIALASAGAIAVHSESMFGRGGAAQLFIRP